ncbi:MAG: hypothetical protein HN712_21315 [Gemmatimonadetes bacterium]|jgi:hypothetical protein|nr:hypothetical protein [Gemmatimonadota bacterium]MBT6148970.1 hypothetical protein [Gemmatimonadota bacterium]MBT7862869.1 hypothetical protein [Gemmatimonadota bacterium]
MNVSAHNPSVSSLTRSTPVSGTRGFDITVSDRGVDVKDVAAATPPPASRPAAAPQAVASTPQLQETLTAQETDALTERFADLPRTSPAGLYGRAGRQAAAPLTAQQGQLIDITG